MLGIALYVSYPTIRSTAIWTFPAHSVTNGPRGTWVNSAVRCYQSRQYDYSSKLGPGWTALSPFSTSYLGKQPIQTALTRPGPTSKPIKYPKNRITPVCEPE